MLQCGLFRSNFAFVMSALSVPLGTAPALKNLGVPSRPFRALQRRGAGDGNRTHVASLEGWSSTIELHPPIPPSFLGFRPSDEPLLHFCLRPRPGAGGGGRIRTYVR